VKKPCKAEQDLQVILERLTALRKSLAKIDENTHFSPDASVSLEKFADSAGAAMDELRRVRNQIFPGRFGTIAISLGRSDSIAKFFAFSFVNQEKRGLDSLLDAPFCGSGVYAIYYHGSTQKAYQALSGTETPIYVGKADPKNPYAETAEDQGQALFARLKEHVKNIKKTSLDLRDFFFRSAAIQSGMQSAVEEFMIRLFRPIWNKQVNICYGIGKHGDSPTTRANKRSPWDTMHPGRSWAADTVYNQMDRKEIERRIASHFVEFPVIADKDTLFKKLSLR
jgi:Eco29kI restriction endonuclease